MTISRFLFGLIYIGNNYIEITSEMRDNYTVRKRYY